MDVKKVRCQFVGCQKHPIFGDPTERVARFCSDHRYKAHVDCMNRRCASLEGCTRQVKIDMTA
ncbi:hypothetical protein T484DRAFT_1788437 [Baffinella frigidus]|nr:hypothetical protein T484DRAFT_1788437 [Cryptophyta sp. CCMP2293]